MFVLKVDNEIELRQFMIADAEELYRLTEKNATYLRKWLPWVDANQSTNDTLNFIYRSQKRAQKNEGIEAAICYNGQLVGAIGHHTIDWVNKKSKIGYWIDQEHQGKGIMTRCVKAFITFGFEELNLNKIEIRVATGNFKSRAIAERLGFLTEGMNRQSEWLYDRYVDHAVYGMLRHEWKIGLSTKQQQVAMPEKMTA